MYLTLHVGHDCDCMCRVSNDGKPSRGGPFPRLVGIRSRKIHCHTPVALTHVAGKEGDQRLDLQSIAKYEESENGSKPE